MTWLGGRQKGGKTQRGVLMGRIPTNRGGAYYKLWETACLGRGGGRGELFGGGMRGYGRKVAIVFY